MSRRRAPRPVISFVICAESPGPRLDGLLRDLAATAAGVAHEVIVALPEPWPDAPRGVALSIGNHSSKGDRLDRAARLATGEVLAFHDDTVRVPARWAAEALAELALPGVAAAGGPIVARPVTTAQRVTALVRSSHFGSGRARYLARAEPARLVPELSTANLAVNAEAFRAVGGFQSPSEGAESARLCYKLRRVLGRSIAYHPELAVHASPPPAGARHLGVASTLGRARGDLARRLPETSPAIPYALPTLFTALLVAAAIAAPFSPLGRAVLAVYAAAYLVECGSLLTARGSLWVRLAACVEMPLVPLAYGAGFVLGYLGANRGEVSPRQGRSALRILVMNWRDVGHPWAGGAEAYMHEIARRWVADGMDVGWLSARYPGSRQIETIDGIRVRRVPGGYMLYAAAAFAFMLRLRNRYDVIVDCQNGIPFFAPLYTSKPVVLLVHHVHQEVFRRDLPWAIRWLPLWLEGSVMPWAYRRRPVVAVSESTRRALVEKGFDRARISVIENGTEMPAANARRASPRSGAQSIVYTGRLKPYKSVDVLLRALPLVLEARPATKLHIVGQGPDRTRLERLSWSLGLAGKVSFHGYLPAVERDAILDGAAVAVCPSAFEGWGAACVQASAHGLPVVAANVPGLVDSVVDGSTGVLVPHGDEVALADAVIALLRSPAQRQAMGDAGREWASRFTWDDSAVRFAGVLEGRCAPDAEQPPLARVPGPRLRPWRPAPRVSVIVTTRNSARTLAACLESIRSQTHRAAEVIVVDNSSTDATVSIASRLAGTVVTAGPERSSQRNHGARIATGDRLLFVDSDMQLAPRVIEECVRASRTADAVIIPESSEGSGFWTRCRALERSCYRGDDSVEAARFFTASAFHAAGGFDEAMLGGEDWDLSRRVGAGARLPRTAAEIRHDEGRVTLLGAMRRKGYYAHGYARYARRHGGAATRRANPILRAAYLRNWRRLAARPHLAAGMFVLKGGETAAVLAAIAIAPALRARELVATLL
jgi:glycosyltransferase involved in cell wall biosynthesis/GT2 family glycosyltransferase